MLISFHHILFHILLTLKDENIKISQFEWKCWSVSKTAVMLEE